MEHDDIVSLVEKIEGLWGDFLQSNYQEIEYIYKLTELFPTQEEFSDITFNMEGFDNLYKRVLWCRELSEYIEREDFGLSEYRKMLLLDKINSDRIVGKWLYYCEHFYKSRNKDEKDEYYSTIYDIYNNIREYENDLIYYFTIFKDDEKLSIINKILSIYHKEIEPIEEDIFQWENKLESKSFELSERAKKYFERAIKEGYITETDDGYKWIWGEPRGKVRLAYFLHEVYNPKGVESIPYKKLELLFGVSRLDVSVDQSLNPKRPQQWKKEIDNKIFYD